MKRTAARKAEIAKRTAKTQPKAPESPPEEAPKVPVCVVRADIVAKTVEMMGSFPLSHPQSVTRDQIVGYLTQLKVVEVNDEGHTS